MLLVRKANARHRWGLPGAHIDPREAPAQAVLRELRRETGDRGPGRRPARPLPALRAAARRRGGPARPADVRVPVRAGLRRARAQRPRPHRRPRLVRRRLPARRRITATAAAAVQDCAGALLRRGPDAHPRPGAAPDAGGDHPGARRPGGDRGRGAARPRARPRPAAGRRGRGRGELRRRLLPHRRLPRRAAAAARHRGRRHGSPRSARAWSAVEPGDRVAWAMRPGAYATRAVVAAAARRPGAGRGRATRPRPRCCCRA